MGTALKPKPIDSFPLFVCAPWVGVVCLILKKGMSCLKR